MKYSITFDHRTIEHLGVRVYSTLPPVLVELISNAYDADKVTIEFSLNPKSIKISDNDHGMTQKKLNNDFLVIDKKEYSDLHPRRIKLEYNQKLGKGPKFGGQIIPRMLLWTVFTVNSAPPI